LHQLGQRDSPGQASCDVVEHEARRGTAGTCGSDLGGVYLGGGWVYQCLQSR
jgi:hypothetical protein